MRCMLEPRVVQVVSAGFVLDMMEVLEGKLPLLEVLEVPTVMYTEGYR